MYTVKRTAQQIAERKETFKKAFDLSLNMLIELSYEDILLAAEAEGEYNEFNPESLKDMLDMIDEILPRKFYNEGNPNNGRRDYQLSLGREGSMVLYIKFHSHATEAINAAQDNKSRIEKIALGIGKADEFDYLHEAFGGLAIRIWWD